MPLADPAKFHLLTPFRESSWRSTLLALVHAAIFIPLLYAALPVAFRWSLVNFTYGAFGLDPEYKAQVPLLFAKTLVLYYGVEVLFRGLLLRGLLQRLDWRKALLIHVLAVCVLSSPWLIPQARQMTGMGFNRFLVQEMMLQALFGLFFIKHGSVLALGALHGTYEFIRKVLIDDVAGGNETLYFYSAGSDDLYWLHLAVTFFGMSLMFFLVTVRRNARGPVITIKENAHDKHTV